ncbi:hypothetical protein, partial [Pseudomonas tolaasii]|uniref:hypothetical protein n=1 Tax=Pseudomonas tolaasii TaxID=29442 RepID=UPI001E49FB8C
MPAIADRQLKQQWLTHRHRRQASSHNGFVLLAKLGDGPGNRDISGSADPLWELSSPGEAAKAAVWAISCFGRASAIAGKPA